MINRWTGARTWILAVFVLIGSSLAVSAQDRADDGSDGVEPKEIARIVANAKRHDNLLDQIAKFEAEPASSVTDLGTLRRQLGAYRALIGYEQTTAIGARVLVNASIRLARYESLAAPLDTAALAEVAEIKAVLYSVQRAYPLAAAWLPLASGTPHGRLIAQVLAKLGQDRFDEVERFESGRYLVRSYRARAKPPNPALLWPKLHLVVTPAGSGRVHDTLTFSLVGQGDAGARRYYLAVHRLNGTRLVAFHGSTAPDYDSVRARVVGLLAAAKKNSQ